MLSNILTFLKTYSKEEELVNRLIVSTYLNSKSISNVKNKFIKKFIINKSDVDFIAYQELQKKFRFDDIEQLVKIFEYVVSPKDKVVTGAVYTPEFVRDYIVQSSLSKHASNQIKVCDPACGCSGFLYTVAKNIKLSHQLSYKNIFENILFGLDINEHPIVRSKILLSLLAIEDGEDEYDFKFNLFKGDALEYDWLNKINLFEGFDIIVGNPPYVCSRNIDETTKALLSNWKVCSTGHPDLYIPFFEIGLKNLKANGVLGYITMNTFFKSINGRALREYFGVKSFNFKIIDFGNYKVFKNKSTYTCICLIEKKKSKFIQYFKGANNKILRNNIRYNSIPYSDLDAKRGWNLNQVDIINKIEKTGKPFGKLFKTRNGIATLKNNIYIFDLIKEDSEYYYLQNGSLFPIEKSICKEIINPNKLNKNDDPNEIKQKVIFPYSFDRSGKPYVLSEDLLKDLYPCAYKYLLTKKSALSKRDKGNGNYNEWYAYGRNQSLEKYKSKLFFPHISSVIPSYFLSNDENLLFYNGISVVSDNESQLKFLSKIMSSDMFWFYIKNTSKPYGSGYYSLSKTYIQNFGIYNFSKDEISSIVNNKMAFVNNLLAEKYKINLTPEDMLAH